MERVDCIVVGAGVIGLAAARALARAGRDVLVLESESAIGSATSSRNSEVVHAGIYYPTGSLKARLCVAGREVLYRFCDHHGVAYRRCGKLIVVTDAAQRPILERLQRQAHTNGVDHLRWLDAIELRALEPELDGAAALLSPSSGIVDSHALMLALLGDAEAHGAVLALRAPVLGIGIVPDGLSIEAGGSAPTKLLARTLVNAAGHGAIPLASRMRGLPSTSVPRAYFAKGSYFNLTGRNPFSHLIYPLPEPGGLGIHLTIDMTGRARFGPDVQWVDSIDYDFDLARADVFRDAIRHYWPALPDEALQPAYAGIRPKLSAPGEPAADFRIDGPDRHGVKGLVNLFGIESPGLTACLSIAEQVRQLLEHAA
ncbi:MAG: NAD(P)/FAD-dependent oxidoreductase [Rhodanobacteraceae bacterium]